MKRPKLSYANLISTLALFIALGGSSYAAITLPHNSVGSAQIRTGAVGTSELRSGAVHLADIAATTKNHLRGTTGPIGQTGPKGTNATSYFAVVDAGGAILRGTANGGGHDASGSGSYTVGFPVDVSSCAYFATLGGGDASAQPPGYVTVHSDGGKVGVQVYDAGGNPVDRPFHLIVGC